MRVNVVKHALAAGEPVVGTWLNLTDPTSARLMCRAGWQYVTLDIEHTAVDWERASTIFAHIADAGCVPLCRVPDGSMENIKRALDAGAWGIVAPMVDTVAQAQAIVDAAYYPPLGRRSVGAGTHYLSFATSDAEYKEKANDHIAVILMTESPEGVANAPAIYALRGVDAVFVGPNDLRAQMRRSLPDGRKPTVAEFEALLEAVRAAGAAAGTPTGIHTFSVEEARARISQGFRFIAVGSDIGFLGAAATEAVAALGIARAATDGAGAGVVGGVGKY